MKVAKFGGTSLASAARVRQVCDIVLSDADRRLVVVSAPGKRSPSDTKVTDLLIRCGEEALAGRNPAAALGAVLDRFREICAELGLPASVFGEIERDLRARVGWQGASAHKYMDRLKAAGEDNTARMTAAYLATRGAMARYVDPGQAGLLLSDEFGNAQVLDESYGRLAKLRDQPGVSVFPGFFGYTRAGDVVTFPRGGSDITGAVLAAAVGADVYENFTDVDSVFSANPKVVPEARPISELTFKEMRELAYAGFGVFHDEAIVPAVQRNIPVWIRNTMRPEAPGTRVVPSRVPAHGSVVGIAGDTGFCTVFASKYLMNREVGFGRRFLQVFEEEGLSYEHVPSGIDNVSIILREKEFTDAKERHVLARIRAELDVDSVSAERGLGLLMIVGEGMRFTPGLAALATGALAAAGINIEMLNQGSSEISMMFGVKAEDCNRAVQALHAAFFGAGRPASAAG